MTCYEILSIIIQTFIAIGTVGAVIVSLWLSFKSDKPKIKLKYLINTENNPINFEMIVVNNSVGKAISIKEIGIINNKKWKPIEQQKIICLKKYYNEMQGNKYKTQQFILGEALNYGEELTMIIYQEVLEDIIKTTKKRKIKFVLIIVGEEKVCLNIKCKNIKNYLEIKNKGVKNV